MSTGITLRSVVLSRFALDGGAMHGIVPKPLWSRIHPADDANRIALCARGIVVDHAASGARVLVEAGMGQAWSDKEHRIYALERGPELPGVLAAAGIDPSTITHVVLTHLHWDHAGGIVLEGGALALPAAEHVVGAGALSRARDAERGDKDAGSFRADVLEALTKKARLRQWRDGEPLAPGLEATTSTGHTDGLVIPFVPARDDGPPVAIPTDLVPTRSHLKPHWVAAYDSVPSRTIAEKRALFEELASKGGGVVLYHDPEVEAAWARRVDGGVELVPGSLGGPS